MSTRRTSSEVLQDLSPSNLEIPEDLLKAAADNFAEEEEPEEDALQDFLSDSSGYSQDDDMELEDKFRDALEVIEQESYRDEFFDARGAKNEDEKGKNEKENGKKNEEEKGEKSKNEDDLFLEDEEARKKREEIDKEEEEAFNKKEEEDLKLEERKRREEKMSPEEKESLKSECQVLKSEGNDAYKSGEQETAVAKYTECIEKCPLTYEHERAVFFANRAAAYIAMEKLEEALEDCNSSILLNGNYVKALQRRGNIFEKQNKPHEAMTDFQKILELDKDHKEANLAVKRLPAKIAQRDEEIKQEMFTNLKKLGSMVLNPFGLSTENFKFVKDDNTGSYSVNFNQNQKPS